MALSAYTEAQGQLEVESSTILDLFVANQFIFCPQSLSFIYFFFLFVVDFVIHWNETAMGLHVFLSFI